jgi:hypothetical protein
MGMEPEMISFLLRIVQTISIGLLWMLINMTLGIYFGLGFFDNKPGLINYIYYAFFLITLALLILYFRKKWKGKM